MPTAGRSSRARARSAGCGSSSRSPSPPGWPVADRILIVEDEPKIAELLRDYLVQNGYEVTTLERGADLVLLDLMLPGKSGLEVCKGLRTFSDASIVMVTARVEEIDRLLGLELGADDYICKPFSPREVVARVKAVLRRAKGGREAQ